MCGIAGQWSKNSALAKEKFDSALNLLQHRGPDQYFSFKTKQANIGTQRLKVIGIEEGQQPISDGSGNYLAFNGAIYNYVEIARLLRINSNSDTEILFQLLLKRAYKNSLSLLRGMFAFAFYNEKDNSFLLSRDRMGQKPLYYYQDNTCLLFSSELKTLKRLMKMNEKTIEINQNAIYHYLFFSNIPEPETIYKNIFSIPPAHFLHYKEGKVEVSPYWTHQYLPKIDIPFAEAKERIRTTLQEAVKIRLRADVKKGLFLSGGWDSSIVALEASKHEENIRAFTVQYPFQSSQNETSIARETARKFGLKHEIIKIESSPTQLLEKSIEIFEQPFADSSALPNLAIAEAASQHVRVLLNGDGGDELFGGYRRYFLAKHISKLSFTRYLKNISAVKKRRSTVGFLHRVARITNSTTDKRYGLYTTDMFQDADLSNLWKKKEEIQTTSQDLIEFYRDANLSELDQLMHWDRSINLASGILTKMDRATMAYSIEARSPYLDHKLFELMNQLPDSYKVSGFNRKHILKSIYRAELPKSVTRAPKTSFEAPLQHWLKHDFYGLIKDLLLNPQAKIYQYVQYDQILGILNEKKYRERNVDYIKYSLLVLEMWLQNNDVDEIA